MNYGYKSYLFQLKRNYDDLVLKKFQPSTTLYTLQQTLHCYLHFKNK